MIMAGSAQAATIDGNFDVVAGVTETYTFSFNLSPDETFLSVKNFKVNGDFITPPAFTLASPGVGQLSFGRSFELTDKSLSVFATLNIVTDGYYLVCSGPGTQNNYVGECGGYTKVYNFGLNSSEVEFFATAPISVMTAEQNTQRLAQAGQAFAEAAVVPIAGTLPLLLSGLGLLGWFARRRSLAAA